MNIKKNYTNFADLGLQEKILKAIKELGYEQPSPIQQQSIPCLLDGQDILGLAQTGTGKTAAFALPIISKINLAEKKPQVLVVAPTRELAIQVAEAFKTYGKYLENFQAVAIYGGQDMRQQINTLKRGVHVIVGTPGRIMDHIRRKSLCTSNIKAVVLDEADEMLRMGFLEDVEWILQTIPENRQTALFSATMPTSIKKVTTKYLNNPTHIEIKSKTSTVEKIEQKVCIVHQMRKADVLLRILEVEDFSAVIIFAATKTSTVDISDRLNKSGFSVAALNGDMNQISREKVIKKLKNKSIDIVVATDVAARGLDVERISHVINYDMPQDCESYVHRIGRTGRAGREGKAILLATTREKRMLYNIERATRRKITQMPIPELADLKEFRIKRFVNEIIETHANKDKLQKFSEVFDRIKQIEDINTDDLLKTLCAIIQNYRPVITDTSREKFDNLNDSHDNKRRQSSNNNGKTSNYNNDNMTKYRLSVGKENSITAGDIVGAIANSASISSKNIGQIKIFRNYSFIWLSNDLSKENIRVLQKTRVRNSPMDLQVYADDYIPRKTIDYDMRANTRRKPQPHKIVKRKHYVS